MSIWLILAIVFLVLFFASFFVLVKTRRFLWTTLILFALSMISFFIGLSVSLTG